MDKNKTFVPDKEKMITETGTVNQSLFYELSHHKEAAQYTLKPYDRTLEDGRVLPSLKRLYMECEDPTEYEFGETFFIDYGHWKVIRQNKAVNKYVDKELGFDAWAEELEVKLKSKAIKSMIQTAELEGSKGTAAARYVAEYGWEKNGRGRPSNKQKAKNERVSNGISSHVLELVNTHGKPKK